MKTGGAVGSQRPDFRVRRSRWPGALQGSPAHPEPVTPGDGHLFLFHTLAVNSCSLRPKAGGGD